MISFLSYSLGVYTYNSISKPILVIQKWKKINNIINIMCFRRFFYKNIIIFYYFVEFLSACFINQNKTKQIIIGNWKNFFFYFLVMQSQCFLIKGSVMLTEDNHSLQDISIEEGRVFRIYNDYQFWLRPISKFWTSSILKHHVFFFTNFQVFFYAYLW